MAQTTSHIAYAYRPGEEVVLRLDGALAYNVERSNPVVEDCLAPWTIGVVVQSLVTSGVTGYVVRIEHDGCACLCVIEEGAIEGIA